MFVNILLPIDLTERHHQAVDTAIELARAGNGGVVLLHVIEIIPGLPIEEEKAFYSRLEQTARQHLARLGQRCKGGKVPVREEVRYGNRVADIVRYANENETDLIILTSPQFDPKHLGTGWGSLSYKVDILASCPVLLVKDRPTAQK